MRQDLWEERFTHTSQTRYSYNFATTDWSDNRMNPHNLRILAEPYTIRLHWKLSKTVKTYESLCSWVAIHKCTLR